MEIDNAATEYLKSLSNSISSPQVKAQITQLLSDYNQKLWHQLTVKLVQFVKVPEVKGSLPALFEKFISTFEKKMNQLELAKIAITVSRSLGNNETEKKANFLIGVSERVKEQGRLDAHIICVMEAAHCKLLAGDAASALETIEKCQVLLDENSSAGGAGVFEPFVHASFYRVAADYAKAKANYSSYYKNALLFLGCLDNAGLDELAPAEKVERARDLGLSALLGDTIYNFGELILHPILNSLVGTPNEWLKKVLHAFNAGDWSQFDALTPSLNSNPLLVQNAPFLRQKMCLMALIETIFQQGNSNVGSTGANASALAAASSSLQQPYLSFNQIAQGCKLPLEEVEHLVMKAASLNLIKCTIDQVEGVVNVTWVQPRVLGRMEQIQQVKNVISAWKEKVHSTLLMVERETAELIVQ